MKLPAFQFYPADWRKDPGVQALSFHDRGVWFEMLCLMHESQERGKLLLNGHPMPDTALARLLGLDKQVLTNTITTLFEFGVISRCEETGALMSRRMVRDEKIRKIRKQVGKLGGNPNLLKQNPNQTTNQNGQTEVNQIPTPSSSSSTSVNSTIPSTRWPTLDEVKRAGASMMPIATEECAEAYFNSRNSEGWLSPRGFALRDWLGDFRNYVTRWVQNERAAPLKRQQGGRGGVPTSSPSMEDTIASLGGRAAGPPLAEDGELPWNSKSNQEP